MRRQAGEAFPPDQLSARREKINMLSGLKPSAIGEPSVDQGPQCVCKLNRLWTRSMSYRNSIYTSYFAMSIGLFAPPFGIGFYTACSSGRVQPDRALPHMWRYLAALTVALAIVAAIPWLSTALI